MRSFKVAPVTFQTLRINSNPNPFQLQQQSYIKFRKLREQTVNFHLFRSHSQQHLREPVFKIQKHLTSVQPQSSPAGKKLRLRQNFRSL